MTRKVGVLGATGSVGQRFILLLKSHPDFKLHALGASERSAGKFYKDAVDWKQTELLPEEAGNIKVSTCSPENFSDCSVVFSGLDNNIAGPIEKSFADYGLIVISNAKNYRRENNVPLVVPLVNSDHLNVIETIVKKNNSSSSSKKPGYIICNSNCSTAGLVVPLKALIKSFGPIDIVTVTTLQALSGAGFSPGVPSMSIIDNVIPYISGEEEKLEYETRKILGNISSDGLGFTPLEQSELNCSAQCNRVAVTDGHMECVSIRFSPSIKQKPSLEQVKNALSSYTCEAQALKCPSAPKKAIHLLEQPDRPQPRLDRDRDNGFAVSVGRVRPDPVFDFKFVVLSHNTVIGAAGSGILIAEILLRRNLL